MTQSRLILIVTWLFAVTSGFCAEPLTPDRLSQELTTLKREVQQLKAEFQRLKVESLERELQQAKADRLRVQTDTTLLQQELEELDEQLSQPLDSQSYAKLSEVRSTMNSERASSLARDQHAAAQRESQLAKSLAVERQKLQGLSSEPSRARERL